jgi:HAD superfamily hydrolase (TIGR01509 family)
MRGAPLPPNWLSTFQARRNVLLEAEVEAVPHIGHAIDVLSRLGLPMAVASGADRMKVELQLNRTGLIEHFQPTDVRIFSATEVARSKPAPDVYLLAASSLGVSPSRCLVIEDSPTGVTAGHAAGMTVLAYAGRNACCTSTAHRRGRRLPLRQRRLCALLRPVPRGRGRGGYG